MMTLKLDRVRASRAKRAFSTRRVAPSAMKTLIRGDLCPLPGDLVLARVDELGKQTKLELTDGRRAHMFPGDEIIVSFGNRYAPDQYEAVIGTDMSPCDLVAAGGIAGLELSRHQRMLPPTKITPLGLIGDAEGERLNLMRFRVDAGDHFPAIPAILSLGTSMNAGKTLTATSLVRGLKRLGHKVAALKITGTGAGGDMWIVRDAGADIAMDFTDAGYATTYLTPVPEIERATFRLLNHAASQGCEIAVIEIADGLQQLETAQLIRSAPIRRIALGTVFAAYDAMGAKYGADVLREAGHAVMALSGRLGRSPLGVREAEAATGLRVYSPWELQEGALVPTIRMQAAERLHASGGRDDALERIARGALCTAVAVTGLAGSTILRPDFAEADHSAAGPKAGQIITLSPANQSAPHSAHQLLTCLAAGIMRAEIAQLCGASFRSRDKQRVNRRNGFRSAVWRTPVGSIPVRVPRLRHGSYQPPFLDPARQGRDGWSAETIESVLAAEDAGLDPALSRLVASLGGEALDGLERRALAEEVRTLLAKTRACTSERSPRLVEAKQSISGRTAENNSWTALSGDLDDGSSAPEDVEHLGAWQLAPRIATAQDLEPEDEDVSVGLAFQAPHALAGRSR